MARRLKYPQRTVTTEELAEALGVSVQYIWQRRSRGGHALLDAGIRNGEGSSRVYWRAAQVAHWITNNPSPKRKVPESW